MGNVILPGDVGGVGTARAATQDQEHPRAWWGGLAAVPWRALPHREERWPLPGAWLRRSALVLFAPQASHHLQRQIPPILEQGGMELMSLLS